MLLPILIPAVVSILGDILAALTDPDNIEAVIETTLVLVGAVIQALVNAIPEIGGVLVKLGDNVGEWLYRYAHQTGLKIGNWLGSVINKIVNFFGSLLSKVKSYLSDIWSKVKSFGSDLISGIKEKFNKVFEIGNAVKTKVSDWISNILGFFKEIPQKVVSIGGNIATGIWSGLKEKMTYLKNKISEFGSEITNKIKSVFKIASPSKLMKTEVGAMLARGIGDGFQMEMKNVTADIEKALPTSFDVNPEIKSGSLNETGGIDYYSMVNAFKQALGEMNIELDDQKVGKFIKKTVSDAIFT
jgi:phage-related protein